MKKEKKKKCPRCGKIKHLWVLSRRANINVCDKCGKEESDIDFGGSMTLVEKEYMLKIKATMRTQAEKEKFFHKLNEGRKIMWMNIEIIMHLLRLYSGRPYGWLHKLSGMGKLEFHAIMFNLEKTGAICRKGNLYHVNKD